MDRWLSRVARVLGTAIGAFAGVAAVQFMRLRRMEFLPAHPGFYVNHVVIPSQGDAGAGGRRLRMVVLGDSTTAGVGVERAEDALPYLIARRVAESEQRAVHVVSYGWAGARAADLARIPAATSDRAAASHRDRVVPRRGGPRGHRDRVERRNAQDPARELSRQPAQHARRRPRGCAVGEDRARRDPGIPRGAPGHRAADLPGRPVRPPPATDQPGGGRARRRRIRRSGTGRPAAHPRPDRRPLARPVPPIGRRVLRLGGCHRRRRCSATRARRAPRDWRRPGPDAGRPGPKSCCVARGIGAMLRPG